MCKLKNARVEFHDEHLFAALLLSLCVNAAADRSHRNCGPFMSVNPRLWERQHGPGSTVWPDHPVEGALQPWGSECSRPAVALEPRMGRQWWAVSLCACALGSPPPTSIFSLVGRWWWPDVMGRLDVMGLLSRGSLFSTCMHHAFLDCGGNSQIVWETHENPWAHLALLSHSRREDPSPERARTCHRSHSKSIAEPVPGPRCLLTNQGAFHPSLWLWLLASLCSGKREGWVWRRAPLTFQL